MTSDIAQSAPDQIAKLAAEALWATDCAAHGLGIEILDIAPGNATLAMTVGDMMVNGHNSAHGGYIFALADTAFAYACNSYGETTVAAHCSISFVRPGKLGGRLIAKAREIFRAGRSGIYDVSVTSGDHVIAEFRGHSRMVGGSFLPALQTPLSERNSA